MTPPADDATCAANRAMRVSPFTLRGGEGFAAHLVKPTDPDDLHATIGHLLMQSTSSA